MQALISAVEGFYEKYMYWLNPPKATITDMIEIIIIAFLLYQVLVWIKDTRAWMLFKGIVVILIFIIIAAVFQMNTILWLAGKTVNVAIIDIGNEAVDGFMEARII